MLFNKRMLNQALSISKKIAERITTTDDGTSFSKYCHLSTALFSNFSFKILKDCCASLGLTCEKHSKGDYLIYGYEKGECNKKKAMVESFAKTMTEYGFPCCVM